MHTRQYNRYDTALVNLYAIGKEHLVPDHLRKLVPCSTATAWRKQNTHELIGQELRTLHSDALELQEILARYARLRRTVLTVVRVWGKVSSTVLPLIRQQADGVERLVDGVQQLFSVMPRKRALLFAGTSATSFYVQLSRLKVKCGISPLELCLDRHPLQLSVQEVSTIQALYADPAFACWPGSSLYYEGLRNRGLGIALSTFYQYVNLLGLKRKWSKAPKKVIGLRSTRPNEFLHADTTHYPLADKLTGSIVLVSDNFSKAILGCSVATNKRAENVVSALRKAISTIRMFHPGTATTVLVADGGGENHANCVEEEIRLMDDPEIQKIIAGKDIIFSNSSIEAINKILKRYLRKYDPRTLAALEWVVAMAIKDYNLLRPHGSLKGLTPIEAYMRPEVSLDYTEFKREARLARLAANRAANCGNCGGGS